LKIRIRYDNQVTAIDVPEEDFTLMIQLDYEKQMAETDHPAKVQRRTPQDIMDERFNKADYNNWHRHYRNWDGDAVPSSIYGGRHHVSADLEASGERHHFDMDEFPDLAAMDAQARKEREDELRAWIREKLKPDYAEMLIAIHMDGLSVTDYASQVGETRTAVSHRLQRAEKKLKEIFKKRPV